MPRRRKDAALDLTQPHELTAGLIEALTCPEGKAQAFLRDTKATGLRVRVTPSGAKAFVFEAKVHGKNLRKTLGPAGPYGLAIEIARDRAAAELHTVRVEKKDPREVERERAAAAQAAQAEDARRAAEKAAERAAAEAAERRRALTVGEAWARYVAERRQHWGERTIRDHEDMTHPGGVPRKRMPDAVTKPGPLAALMPLRLVDLDAEAVGAWAAREAAERPARVRLALRLLKAFLRWAAAEKDLSDRANPAAVAAKKVRELAGKAKPKEDVLQREQLPAWFQHVRAIGNPVIAAYLQTLLLTGARPGEVLALRWEDLNVQWRGITIRDKVEGERQIPLTPYVWSLLSALPRRNQWVFSSTRALSLDPKHEARRARYHERRGQTPPAGDVAQASESGRIAEPGAVHRQACAAAGLDGLTLHGLRRSFASLTEWLEVPVGVVAQIQGHKPSATAEKHYKRRPLDLLRVHHERIEAWVLERAGIEFKAEGKPGLRAVVA